MFNVEVGLNSKTHGICCLAIGDNTVARGAYCVSVGEKITLPNNFTKASAIAVFNEINEMKLTFQAMVDQKVAPPEFGPKSIEALNYLALALEKHFGKNMAELMKDVEQETKEKEAKEKEANNQIATNV